MGDDLIIKAHNPTLKVFHMSDIPVGAADRLLRRSGGERVSAEASVVLREALEDFAIEVGKKAVELAHHRHRKTIGKDDILLALSLLREER